METTPVDGKAQGDEGATVAAAVFAGDSARRMC